MEELKPLPDVNFCQWPCWEESPFLLLMVITAIWRQLSQGDIPSLSGDFILLPVVYVCLDKKRKKIWFSITLGDLSIYNVIKKKSVCVCRQ